MAKITPQEAIDLLRDYYKEREDAILTAKRFHTKRCNNLDNMAIEWPHKVGDVIKVRTWTYTGKEMLITRRGVVQHPVMYTQTIGYEGFILKKDGAPSKKSHTVPVSHYLEGQSNDSK